jgi:hypothetical protein
MGSRTRHANGRPHTASASAGQRRMESVATVQKAVAASCRLVSMSVRVSEVQSAGEIPGGVSVSV